jgi:hypothetical protein
VLASTVALVADLATLEWSVPTVSMAGSRRERFTMDMIDAHAFGGRVGTVETSQRRSVAGSPSAIRLRVASVRGSWIRMFDRPCRSSVLNL